MNVEDFYNKSEYSKIDFGSNPTLFTKKELLDFANKYLEAITVTRCCDKLKDKDDDFSKFVNDHCLERLDGDYIYNGSTYDIGGLKKVFDIHRQ